MGLSLIRHQISKQNTAIQNVQIDKPRSVSLEEEKKRHQKVYEDEADVALAF